MKNHLLNICALQFIKTLKFKIQNLKFKIIFILNFIFFLLFSSSVFSYYKITNPNIVGAPSAILIDAETGQILYEKNAHKKMMPASTTKILTTIIAIEKGNLQDIVTVGTRPAARHWGESKLGLKPGEKLTLEQLLYAVMVKSCNDASVAVAEYIGGSVENFAKMMNEKAKEIGALESHFTNPHGFYGDAHYTTAYDLAKIGQYAIKNAVFRKFCSTKKVLIPDENHKWNRVLINRNKLLFKTNFVDGIKTGATKKAGYCLVSTGVKEGRRLIAVVMKSPNVWQDSENLLNFGFNNFYRYKVLEEGETITYLQPKLGTEKKVYLVTDKNFYWNEYAGNNKEDLEKEILMDSDSNKLPIKKGEKLGTLVLKKDGEVVTEINLIADKNCDFNWKLVGMLYGGMPFSTLSLLLVGIKIKRRKPKRRLRDKYREIYIRKNNKNYI